MNLPVHKLLSIILIFLLGLSPLPSVIGDMSVPVDHTNMPCHMSADSVDMSDATQPSANNCEMCSTVNDCNNSCGQCVTNVLALLHYLLPVSNSSSSLDIIQSNESPIDQQPPALFRPPRV